MNMSSKFKPVAVTPLKSSLVFHSTQPVRNEERVTAASNFLDWCADVAHVSGRSSHVTMQHDLKEDMFTAVVESGPITFAMTHRDPFYVFKTLSKQLFKYYEKLNACTFKEQQAKKRSPGKKNSGGRKRSSAAR